MPDRKPPRLNGDGFATVRALLAYQRTSLVDKAAGVTAEQATWSPVPSRTSLLWLIRHVDEAERTWVVRRFAGIEDAPATQDPTTGTDPLEAAIASYRTTWTVVDGIVDDASGPDARCRGDTTEPPVDLFWILAHLVEETARHAGHADILRELIDGSTGR